MTKYVVARLKDGEPLDWIYEVGPEGQISVCTAKVAAKQFDTYDEAADAAGRAMDRGLRAEFSAVPA